MFHKISLTQGVYTLVDRAGRSRFADPDGIVVVK